MKKRYTESGNFVVYWGKHTGSPELFKRAWYFEPDNYDGGIVYSDPYPTAAAALAAAEDWDAQQEWESQIIDDGFVAK